MIYMYEHTRCTTSTGSMNRILHVRLDLRVDDLYVVGPTIIHRTSTCTSTVCRAYEKWAFDLGDSSDDDQ